MTRIDLHESSKLTFAEGAAPSTPASGLVLIYAKTDGNLYQKDDAGTETGLATGGGGNVATDTIWNAKGDLAGGTGADTAARLAVGSNGQVLTADSTQSTGLIWATPSGGGLIAYAAITTGGPVTGLTSTSVADVDATNAKITFTAPSTGNVLVRVSLAWNHSTFTDAWLGIRESTTLKGERYISTSTIYAPVAFPFIVTGLTPSSSYTYKLTYRVASGTGRAEYSTTAGPLVFEVWTAP